MNVEEETPDAVLQSKQSIFFGEKEYHVEPPTIATLLLVSKELADLPKEKLDENFAMNEVFNNVKHANSIARSVAIMILGAKHIREQENQQKITNKKEDEFLFFKLKRKSKTQIIPLNDLDKLTQTVLDSEIKELVDNYLKLMSQMQVNNFFMLITFLTEITMTKPTKKAIKTTVSGQ